MEGVGRRVGYVEQDVEPTIGTDEANISDLESILLIALGECIAGLGDPQRVSVMYWQTSCVDILWRVAHGLSSSDRAEEVSGHRNTRCRWSELPIECAQISESNPSSESRSSPFLTSTSFTTKRKTTWRTVQLLPLTSTSHQTDGKAYRDRYTDGRLSVLASSPVRPRDDPVSTSTQRANLGRPRNSFSCIPGSVTSEIPLVSSCWTVIVRLNLMIMMTS